MKATPEQPTRNSEKLQILMLLTDGFGGFGGIAKFNRDFLGALSSSEDVAEIIALPRLIPEQTGVVPPKIRYSTAGLGGKVHYIVAGLRAALELRKKRGDYRPLIVCAHINLLPAAVLARRICGGRLYLIVHGIDAWQPPTNPLARRSVRRIDDFISVSELTRQRFLQWSRLRQDQGIILPDCVDLRAFQPGPKSAELVKRYNLEGERVLMTLGRLDPCERYKGVDEVIECLPEIGKALSHTLQSVTVTYLIAGDGNDRPRLVEKAGSLGLRVNVDRRSTEHGARSGEQSGSREGADSGIGFPWRAVAWRRRQPMSYNSPARPHWQDANATAPRVVFTGRIEEKLKADYLAGWRIFLCWRAPVKVSGSCY